MTNVEPGEWYDPAIADGEKKALDIKSGGL